MPSSNPNLPLDVLYSEPRLRLSILGRRLIRIATFVTYLIATVLTGTFLISDITSFQALGMLFGLILVDRLIHHKRGDRSLSQVSVLKRANLAKFTSPATYGVLEKSFDRALFLKEDFELRLLLILLGEKNIRRALRRVDVRPEEFIQKTEELIRTSRGENKKSRNELYGQVEKIIFLACKEAVLERQNFIEPWNLFSAVASSENQLVNRLFVMFGLDQSDISRAVLFDAAKRNASGASFKSLGGMVYGNDRAPRHRVMNRAWTARPTPNLDRMSEDLTDLARSHTAGFLIGHDEEYDRLLQVLARPLNPNALLVGEPGIGKEAIIAHLALALVKDKVPNSLFDLRLVKLDLNELFAGAPSEVLQSRLKAIVEEIGFANNIILYIPDIHNLVKNSNNNFLSVGDALLPIIRNHRFPVIGTTYPHEYQSLIEPRSDFAALFETIPVKEISSAEAERILINEAVFWEKQNKIFISLGAIRKAVELGKHYFRNKFLPTSAEEILKSALVVIEERGEKNLNPDLVLEITEEKLHVPLHVSEGKEADQLLHLEDLIHEQMINQTEAVKAVANALRQYRAGLARASGPIASFLFVGPTGVGKTELAKAVAKIQFGSTSAMVRFDLTEYQDKGSLTRFIGSPSGEVLGALTESVRAKPFSLVLLDEFEKAHPDIWQIFLQVLDEGWLTDALGRKVDFSNTIIVATSNAHSDLINTSLNQGETMANISEYLKSKLTDIFRPELLNRFSRIIVFRDLNLDEMTEVAKLNLKDLSNKIMEQGIKLNIEETALRAIAKLGYDPAFGARPLRRVIDEKIREPLAELILQKKLSRGSEVKIYWQDEIFKFDF